jgi:hypothetical protein
MKKLKLSALTIALFSLSNLGFALSSEPSITISNMVGSQYSGWADSMFPFATDPNKMLYGDLQAQGSDDSQAMISAGLGYRYAKNTRNILGSYFFVDRERSAGYQYYTVLGPGLEWMTPTWSYRLNAYFPIGDKSHKVSSGWADEYGNYNYESFKGHKQLDVRADLYENLSYGGDTTISYRFAQNSDWQIDLSPYAYKQDGENAMMGGKAQINYYSNGNTQVFIADEYDNKNKNSVILGISFSFGARNNDTSTTALMNSPVLRNLMVNTTENGLAVDQDLVYGDTLEVEENHIYFVNGNSSSSSSMVSDSQPDGTYNNPYTSAEQAAQADTPNGADFWLASSPTTYSISEGGWDLQEDQSITGRSTDYKQDASGSDRPTIKFQDSDGIVMDSSNDLAHIQIMGSGHIDNSSNTGLIIKKNNDSNEVAQINDVKIGITNNTNGYITDIKMKNGAKAYVTNSTLNSYFYDGGGDNDFNNATYNIYAAGNNVLTVADSTLNAVANNENGNAMNIWANNGTELTAAGNNLSASGEDYAINIAVGAESSAEITSNVMSTYTDGTIGRSFNIDSYNYDSLTIEGNTMTGTSENYEAAGVYLQGEDAGDADINNNSFTLTGDKGATGVINVARGDGTTSVTNNTFNLTATEEAFGIVDYFGNTSYSGNTYNLNADWAEDIYPVPSS